MDGKLSGRLSVVHSLSGSLSAASTQIDVYGGPTEVVPSQETQVLATEGRMLTRDVVVDPIPSNYGRITYDGLGITII